MNDLRKLGAGGTRLTVDVIIPTRNRVGYLEECISSVARQTLQPDRVLVVDDGSTDGSLELLHKLAAEWDRLVIIPNATSRGVSAARNIALARSTADLIAVIDSDDSWEPDKLRQQVALFTPNRPDLGLVYSGFRRVGSDGLPLDMPIIIPDKRGWIFNELLEGFQSIAPTTMVMRRDLLVQIGGFDETLIQAEDRDITLKLARISEFDCISASLANYRVHQGSMYETAMKHEPDMILFQRLRVWNRWTSDSEPVLKRFRREAVAAASPLSFFWPRTGLYHRLRRSELALARALFPTPRSYFPPSRQRVRLRLDLARDFVARRIVAKSPALLRMAQRFGKLRNFPAPRDPS
jgi:glycosyltransferase involved in cell wall biosynthesis